MAYKGMSTAGMNPEQGVTVALPDDAPSEVMVDLGDEGALDEITIDPDTGEVTIEIEEEEPTGTGHMDNLAESMSDEDLKAIGQYICDCVDEDIKSRDDWFKRYRAGLQALGIYNVRKVNETIDAVEIKHPILIEAAVQFQARAMAELMPPGGPVKAGIAGDYTDEIMEQGQRVEKYMNYQLTIEDRGYYDEQEMKLLRLAFSGSEFDKQYHDPVKKRVVSRWVESENMIVPYSAKCFETAPRYTHQMPITLNEYRKMVKAGYYRDIDGIGKGSGDDVEEGERGELLDAMDEIDGVSKPGTNEHHVEMTFLETHIEYDLPGFEDEDGIALPYTITVDRETQEVLSIYRNWREDDENREKRIWFTHKKFLPGLGFYGYGLLHTIGALGETASKLLEILIDSGAFATLQGGFKSKDAKMKGDVVLTPGEWHDTEMTAEELARAFYTPPFKEPSATLFQLLGMLIESGQRFAATTETMVGEAATTGPVGTMVAQVEQGSKVFSGIHRRLHKAYGDEFIHIAELNGETLPDAYPYFVKGEAQEALRSDFDGRVDIIPVSDPNIFSSAQRLAIAQTGMQLVAQNPDMGDRRAAVMGVLQAIRFPDPERLFPSPKEAQRLDPVSEGIATMSGQPIKSFLDQDHQAHIMVHQFQMTQMLPQAQPAMQAHIAEHMAMAYAIQMQQMMGAPVPPFDFGEKMGAPVPPEIENQIAMLAAQASQQALQQLQMQQEEQAAAQNQQMQQMQQQMQQMAQQLQAAQLENSKLQMEMQAAATNQDAQKELLKLQGKQLDNAKEQTKLRGKAMDLANAQIANNEKSSKKD